jgi:NAD(P)-dependent dehydrogenase (short-subunit alcohol dehydrogenase family)
MAVNVRGTWLFSKEFVTRALAVSKPGVIVNASSTNAFYAERDIPAYSASKGAILALTKAMALDHAEDRIRVNCICPGIIESGLTTPWFDSMADPPGARRIAGAAHALDRIGQPAEVARVVVFLSSEEASFFTGSAVVVDGGLTAGRRIL